MAHFASRKVLYVTLDSVSPEKPEAGGEWIAIRAAVSLGQRTQMQAALFEIDGKSGAKADMGRYLAAFNHLAIVDWYLVDEGQVVPCTPENIDGLDAEDPLVDKAMREFAERNPLSRLSGGQSG